MHILQEKNLAYFWPILAYFGLFLAYFFGLFWPTFGLLLAYYSRSKIGQMGWVWSGPGPNGHSPNGGLFSLLALNGLWASSLTIRSSIHRCSSAETLLAIGVGSIGAGSCCGPSTGSWSVATDASGTLTRVLVMSRPKRRHSSHKKYSSGKSQPSRSIASRRSAVLRQAHLRNIP